MAEIDIDFEGTGVDANGGNPDNKPQEGAANAGGTKEDVTSLDGTGTDDITGKDGTKDDKSGAAADDTKGKGAADGTDGNKGSGDDTIPSTGELTPGTQLEVDGEVYTVATNGDVVDKDGKVIKQASEVKDWLASFEQEEDNTLDINTIKDTVGVEVTDENGKPIEYTNDAAGIKAYVSAVIDLKSKELQQGAINKLYSDNPLLKQFQDYVEVTGSPAGFGELPDRTGWEIDKDNTNQQEAIVRMAAKEFGNLSLNDNYIKYLKDTGGLYDEAVNQLKALQEKDTNVRKDIAARAEAARVQEQKELEEYWNKVNNVITSGNIAGYKLPASFVKEVNGQKQTLTPNDFFNYLSKHTEVDANGNKVTAYMKDLANESDDDYLNRELISAWLMYTGGTYKDLVDMAIKEEEVRVLKLKSRANSAKKTVKFVKPQSGKAAVDDILLG